MFFDEFQDCPGDALIFPDVAGRYMPSLYLICLGAF